ncbi:uncharacterized protein BCR38DRAFT_469045 [Pseudomassariella vexata]|uniref:Peptide hydrolase n=1 Tax=Pseudomassariella vexata TaxID=1141098 RepID=A0A1Y2DDY0_9PEZI|nr:uncharacterized protein BCR38DRAFT_469045 [Pseudomassariella vexata]ORY57493.1 hypothetical protein BCR38DRAFT_469045 [Pseudomassariella vexata]
MRAQTVLASVALTAPALVEASNSTDKLLVSSIELQSLITLEDLLAGSQKLQDIADANDGNRAFGSGGHNATVDYLYDTLNALGYYDVIKQPFTEVFSGGNAALSAGGVDYSPNLMTYTPRGTVSAPLVLVSDLGCAAEDFPAEVSGNVALILRGTCSFAEKSLNAGAAGAVGAVVYNNVEAALSGTLGTSNDAYVPTVSISQEEGNALIAALESGEVVADLVVNSILENRTNYNVIAETKDGDHDNVLVLGGHSDSVEAGPGINDDGSGSIGVLNVALALSKFTVKNSVRFAFWGAEEFGKLGSYYYIKQLNTSEVEIAKIRAYLNFDMIASPNYVYGIYDGDGSAFNLSGPAGSAQIEKDFEDFYTSKNTPFIASEFSGRSDYSAFIMNGIPSGGLFTGAEVIKTEEEAAQFGGEAGVAYDVNYHQAGDTMDNLAHDAYLLNTQSIANSVAKYALSFDSLPPVDLSKRMWAADRAKFTSREVHSHATHSGPCGQSGETK